VRVAVIDIGTNSIRIEAFQIDKGLPTMIFRSSTMPKLGLNIKESKLLHEKGKEYALKALEEFTSKDLKIDKIIAVGTSALRQAENSEEFLKEVKDKTGIKIEIITGKQEAFLTSIAISKFEPTYSLFKDKNSIIIDVGGGSTEVALLNNSEVYSPHSLEVGAITTKFNQYPVTIKDIESFNSKIDLELSNISQKFYNSIIDVAFCSSGTARTIAKTGFMKKSLNGELNIEDLSYLIGRLKTLTIDEIKQIEGIDSKRADIILPGSLILYKVLEKLNISKFIVSNFSLRHGLLARLDM